MTEKPESCLKKRSRKHNNNISKSLENSDKISVNRPKKSNVKSKEKKIIVLNKTWYISWFYLGNNFNYY
jgi:hypothetical protein